MDWLLSYNMSTIILLIKISKYDSTSTKFPREHRVPPKFISGMINMMMMIIVCLSKDCLTQIYLIYVSFPQMRLEAFKA